MVKKVLILFGSPRENSNTKALLQPFEQRLRALGCETEIIRAYEEAYEKKKQKGVAPSHGKNPSDY